MFLRILGKDLKRNKTMNVILLLFTVLAAVFVASGLNNLVSIMNGTDYFLDRAGAGDYVAIVACGEDDSEVRKVLDESEVILSYRSDKVLFGETDNIRDADGKVLETDSSIIIQNIEESQLHFFDENDQTITEVKKGYARVSFKYMKEQNLKAGDKIRVKYFDHEQEFILDGGMKDALFGSSFMGNVRLLIGKEDAQDFYRTEGLAAYMGRIYYLDSDQPMKCKSEFSKVDKVMFDDPRSTIKMTYVMDMIVAFVVVILSLCLMVVSFVLIRFAITFAITEDYREIGVMKAIGIRERKIRSLYLVKYAGLGALGSVIGCFLSFPFGNLLMKGATENMVLGDAHGLLYNLLGALLVFALIVGFAYLSTGRLKKMTPADAIRSGETGERFRKKGGLRITGSHFGNSFYLAFNDVLSSPKRFVNIIIAFTLCTMFVLVLSNTTATLDSESCIDTFGARADLYITNLSSELMFREDGKELMEQKLSKIEEDLKGLGMPGKCSIEVQYSYKFSYDGGEYLYTFQQGLGTKAGDYLYEQGSAPQNKNEIAITKKVASDTGLRIGDTIEIDFGTSKEICTVTAIYQTMNRMGSVIRLHEDAPTSFLAISGFMQYAVQFEDHPSKELIESRKATLKDFYDNDKIMNQREYCVDCMKALDTVKSVEKLLLLITIIVVLLVTILMERSFISDEKKEIAILKAVGFRDSSVIGWQVLRFVLVTGCSMVLAMALSVPVTKLCMSPVFGLMGASRIRFVYSMQSLIRYPLFILAAATLFAWCTALYTGSIQARDTASIE